MKNLLFYLVAFLFCSVSFAGVNTVSVPTPIRALPTVETVKEHPTTWVEKLARPFQKKANIGLLILSIIIPIISTWKIFSDNGVEGWWSLIPIGNTIKFLSIIGKPWYHIFLLLVPILNIVKMFQWNIALAEKSGKSVGFGIGLTLLYPIFGAILAWGGDK